MKNIQLSFLATTFSSLSAGHGQRCTTALLQERFHAIANKQRSCRAEGIFSAMVQSVQPSGSVARGTARALQLFASLFLVLFPTNSPSFSSF